MSATADECIRYVLAEDAESGQTRCFGAIPARVDRTKDPYKRRKWIVHYYPQYSLRAIYTGDRNYGWLEASPFWLSPRLVTRHEVPNGVQIP